MSENIKKFSSDLQGVPNSSHNLDFLETIFIRGLSHYDLN